MSDQEHSRQQFEAAVIARLSALFPNGTSAELMRGAMLQRGLDGEYADRQRAGEWWAWQASREALQFKPVAWIDSDTLQTMQATGRQPGERWPVVRLSEWEDKSAHTALCVAPTA